MTHWTLKHCIIILAGRFQFLLENICSCVQIPGLTSQILQGLLIVVRVKGAIYWEPQFTVVWTKYNKYLTWTKTTWNCTYFVLNLGPSSPVPLILTIISEYLFLLLLESLLFLTVVPSYNRMGMSLVVASCCEDILVMTDWELM